MGCSSKGNWSVRHQQRICAEEAARGIEAAQPRVTISVSTAKAHVLAKDVYGTNSLFNTGPIAYTNPGLAKTFSELGARVIRFPGGTPANFYNFKTGYHDVPDIRQSKRHHQQIKNANTYTRLTKGDIGGYRTEHFLEFQKRTGADVSLVLNICTQDSQYTREWLTFLREKGLQVKYIEVGNEIYFGIYKNLIISPDDYIQKAKAHVKVAKEIFPDARIGAVVSSHSYTNDSFVDQVESRPNTSRNHIWDKTIAKADFYDAIVIHMYGSPQLSPDLPFDKHPAYSTIYRNCMSHDDFQYGRTIAYLKRTFPGKAIWVTEYHVGGFAGNLRKSRLRHSPLGVLYACNFFINLAATPDVELGAYHSFAQMVRMETDSKRGRVASRYHHDVPVTTANYSGFKFFSEAVGESDRIVRNTITGGDHYSATGKYKGRFPELNSVTMLGANVGWVFIVNKFGKTHTVDDILINDRPRTRISEVVILKPESGLDAERVIAKSETPRLPLKLPPYSITKVKLAF
jgi:hypothetical protein